MTLCRPTSRARGEQWNDSPSSSDLIYRFLELHGASRKIAAMAAQILVRQYGVFVRDHFSIDLTPNGM
jgi:hypothetical protein